MSDIVSRIKGMMNDLADDGSKELARQWITALEDSSEVVSLMNNSAFKKIADKMKADFLERVDVLVKKDPELAAMRRMFVRTFGMAGAAERIETSLREYIDNPESVNQNKVTA